MLDSNPWINVLVVLTVGANIATVAMWIMAIAATFGIGRSQWSRLRASLGQAGLPIAAIVAATTMIGSLYLSEGAHFTPCKLCWYQRIGAYPLAIILVVAALRRDWGVRPYALVLSCLTPIVSIYHYTIERFPSLEQSTSCDPTNPCTFTWFFHLHYISIPFMALSSFALVTTVLLVARPEPMETSNRRTDAHPQEA